MQPSPDLQIAEEIQAVAIAPSEIDKSATENSATDPAATETAAGFRLQQVEVLNWGTFEQRPWNLSVNGGTALLTGANGSGKSTLVDAIVTLLVPNKGGSRSYNKASSTSGKSERNEKSYVQGAYGRTRSEDSYASKTKYLREKGALSVLLAHFFDALSEQTVMLAQVLWMDAGKVRKFFGVSDRPLSIAENFAQFDSISELKQQLQTNGAELFDGFSAYSQRFRKRMGLQSEKALDLFNQTVSIKEIGGLNDFVRSHMLEKADVQAKILALQESYENLTVSHTAIQKAKRQLEGLEPLTKAAKRYAKLEKDLSSLEIFRVATPIFFAREQKALLVETLKQIVEQLARTQSLREKDDQQVANLRADEKRLEIAISQDSGAMRIRELEQAIERAHQTVQAKKQCAQDYNKLAAKLKLAEYDNRESFYAAKTQGETLRQEIADALQQLEQQRDAQKLRQAEFQAQQKELEDELTSLGSRKSQIPMSNLALRDRLANELNLDSYQLPFIGELLQVRSEAKEWEGAIERLLRGFGLCLLVPQVHYRDVNAYVNKTHLQGRVVYYRVTPSEPDPTQRSNDPKRVPSKLNIKQDDETFYQWLRERLAQQYSYVCCESIAQFQRETTAITPTGLIKSGGERHEKDDRSKIGDRSKYILGWDNADKIKALESDLQQVKLGGAQVEQQIRTLERAQKKQRDRASWLQDFARIAEFSDIDWRSAESDRLELTQQKQKLEKASNQLKLLKTQLETAQAELARVEQRREQSIREMQTLEDSQRRNLAAQAQCEKKLLSIEEIDLTAFEQGMAKTLKKYPMTLESIVQDEADLKEVIQAQLTEARSQLSSTQSTLEKAMLRFNNDFPETTLEITASIEYLSEYLALKAQIEKDDLPKHEERFKALMNEKVVIAISMFKTDLERQEEDIRTAIDDLNQSLEQIDYTDSTYIKLCYDQTRSQEIKDFKADLKLCLGDVARQSEADHETRFQNIRTRLIDRFKSGDRWTKLVTDVRNWLDFSVSERYRADEEEKEHHTDSSGKSGGQKVKLAYTILASAIAYQFGLNPSPDQNGDRHKSFRFVVIDEAFSKSDDSNARYAMELFKNLQLQLLVITPQDKIHVIEPYISNLHYVSNNAEGSYSEVASLSIEAYREKREQTVQANRD
ncbi:MAG: hypothetical protein DCF25_12220 [Leptolyngbya foveolarum]|uniref:ATP-binding protein n=1 Tax=Leptolyngbya foveolarum TaxID=47253 RepID=A0A2W4UBB9_9CYAN|nr:MAG: hypothetical protein DCF25_12220 [Leptolyngbya foveolarum]